MDKSSYIRTVRIPEFSLWPKAQNNRTLLSLSLEITARCNNNCIHCYINLPETDKTAIQHEVSFDTIKKIIDDAERLGTLWVLLSGGEPLLREDFADIYQYIKKKGMLVSVFTNGTLISSEHIKLFRSYPPRALEITVYGISEAVHKKITRNVLFEKTITAIEKLKSEKIPFSLKTVIMKSNFDEFKEIYQFCIENSETLVRVDPFLNLRYDRNPEKNLHIQSERLSPEEIVTIENFDKKRMVAIESQCLEIDKLLSPKNSDKRLFRCSAGINSCCISYDGKFKLCNALTNKEYTYNLKDGSLEDAWKNFTPKIRLKESANFEYDNSCGKCTIYNLCMCCPANNDLETGAPDTPVQYFCDVAQKRYCNYKKTHDIVS